MGNHSQERLNTKKKRVAHTEKYCQMELIRVSYNKRMLI